jgi:hypothetical protein
MLSGGWGDYLVTASCRGRNLGFRGKWFTKLGGYIWLESTVKVKLESKVDHLLMRWLRAVMGWPLHMSVRWRKHCPYSVRVYTYSNSRPFFCSHAQKFSMILLFFTRFVLIPSFLLFKMNGDNIHHPLSISKPTCPSPCFPWPRNLISPSSNFM